MTNFAPGDRSLFDTISGRPDPSSSLYRRRERPLKRLLLLGMVHPFQVVLARSPPVHMNMPWTIGFNTLALAS